MKQLNYVLGALVLAMMIGFSSCEKQTDSKDELTEVSFTFDVMTDLLKKDGDIVTDLEIICPDNPNPVKVAVTINVLKSGAEETFVLDLIDNFEDGNQTTVIDLPVGVHEITRFLVYDDADNVIYATPESGSTYGDLYADVLTSVNFDFTTEAFKKKKVIVDVLCFEEFKYEAFGFNWFQFNTYATKTLCFFGDVCTKFYEAWHTYQGDPNPYAMQDYDGFDFPAIFRVEVVGEGWTTSSDNIELKGEGPVCVDYLDNLQIDGETYEADIYLQLPDGGELLLGSVPFTDADQSNSDDDNSFGGENGVFTFTVGDCNHPTSDASFALPWMPLPQSAVMTVLSDNPAVRGGESSYVDIVFKNIVGNYDVPEIRANNSVDGWCAAQTWTIYIGQDYPINFYSSLYPASLPTYLQGINYDALNWLANNFDILRSEGFNADQFQEAIWYFTNGAGSGSALTTRMSTEGNNYIIPLGGYAFVLLDPNIDGKTNIQIMMIKVDP